MDPRSIARAAAAVVAAAARRLMSARAVKTLKTTLAKTSMLAAMLSLFAMSLAMIQEGPGAPTTEAAAALVQWHASTLTTCLPAPAFAVYTGAVSAFTAYSGWPVLLTLMAGAGQVHGEAAVYYWFFVVLMSAAVPLVIAGAIAGHD